jgi:hypothetical protein
MYGRPIIQELPPKFDIIYNTSVAAGRTVSSIGNMALAHEISQGSRLEKIHATS